MLNLIYIINQRLTSMRANKAGSFSETLILSLALEVSPAASLNKRKISNLTNYATCIWTLISIGHRIVR